MQPWSEHNIPCGEAKINRMRASFLLLLVTKENQLIKRRLVDSIALGSVPGSGMAWQNTQPGGTCVVDRCSTNRGVPPAFTHFAPVTQDSSATTFKLTCFREH